MNKTIRKIIIVVIALITIVSVSGIVPATAQISPEIIRAQINALWAQVVALQAQLAREISAPTSAFNFTRDLTIGSTGEDVRALQRFLNSRGFIVATTGVGSPGNESTRFGPRTQTALARFQTDNNISPAHGFFGPITRGTIMELTASTPISHIPIILPCAPGFVGTLCIAPTPPPTPVFNFTRDLSLGSVGEDVRALQRFLNSRGFTVATTGPGSIGNETTTFDFLTQAALIRFQTASNIFPAHGFFDSVTRWRIIDLTTPTPTPPPTPVFNFTRDLSLGSVGEDVRALQRFLNSRGFTVATTGPGSIGNETTTFDFLTQAALIRFQTASNIFPAHGFFDSVTRERVMFLISPGTTTPVTNVALVSAISPATPASAIVSVGTTGRADVAITTVRYTATNEPIILQDITITQTGTAPRTVFNSIEIIDGTRIISLPIIPSTGDIIFRDVNIEIPVNEHRDITVRADLAGIGQVVTSGQTVELDVNVTRARGRNSNANVTTGLGNIAGGNPMTIRQTIPTVTIDSAATLGTNRDGIGGVSNEVEVFRISVTADAGGDVFLREISITPTTTHPVEYIGGIAVFQGITERGRVMNLITDGLWQNVRHGPVRDIYVGVGEIHKYQVGQIVMVQAHRDLGGRANSTRVIVSKDHDSIILDRSVLEQGNVRTVFPGGFTSGHTYRIPLTGAFIPRGTTSVFSVFTNLTAFDTNDIQVKISADTSAGTTGNFVWREGANTPNINGHLIGGFPITGPTVNWRR